VNKYRLFYKGKNTLVEAKTPYEAQRIGGSLWKIKNTYKIAWLLVEKSGQAVDVENQIRFM